MFHTHEWKRICCYFNNLWNPKILERLIQFQLRSLSYSSGRRMDSVTRVVLNISDQWSGRIVLEMLAVDQWHCWHSEMWHLIIIKLHFISSRSARGSQVNVIHYTDYSKMTDVDFFIIDTLFTLQKKRLEEWESTQVLLHHRTTRSRDGGEGTNRPSVSEWKRERSGKSTNLQHRGSFS